VTGTKNPSIHYYIITGTAALLDLISCATTARSMPGQAKPMLFCNAATKCCF